MGNVIIQYRDFGDGTFSVIARIFNPNKKFYEHPSLINLTKEDCIHEINKIIDNPPNIEEVENDWVYIGD